MKTLFICLCGLISELGFRMFPSTPIRLHSLMLLLAFLGSCCLARDGHFTFITVLRNVSLSIVLSLIILLGWTNKTHVNDSMWGVGTSYSCVSIFHSHVSCSVWFVDRIEELICVGVGKKSGWARQSVYLQGRWNSYVVPQELFKLRVGFANKDPPWRSIEGIIYPFVVSALSLLEVLYFCVWKGQCLADVVCLGWWMDGFGCTTQERVKARHIHPHTHVNGERASLFSCLQHSLRRKCLWAPWLEIAECFVCVFVGIWSVLEDDKVMKNDTGKVLVITKCGRIWAKSSYIYLILLIPYSADCGKFPHIQCQRLVI